jgi:hypothetical protein
MQTAVLAAVALDPDDALPASVSGALAAAFATSTPWSIGAQVGLTYASADDLDAALAVSVGRPLDGELSTYVELFTTSAADALTLQHGYALRLGPAMQVDASVGIGVLDAPTWLVSVGWTGRF